jgi:hypothetical protein
MGITAAVFAVAGTAMQYKAAQAQNKAQDRAAKMERRAAEIENVRRARRGVAERRIQQAEILQGAAATGMRGSSAVSGAVGSLTTQTASSIGAANTQLAANIGANRALIKGAKTAGMYNTLGSLFQAGSGLASSGAFTKATPPKPLVATIDTHLLPQRVTGRING